MQSAAEFIRAVPPLIWIAAGVVFIGIIAAYVVGSLVERLFARFGVSESIEGTSFERTARDFGTSTVVILSRLTRYFLIGLAFLIALSIAGFSYADQFWSTVAGFVPQLFLAVLIVILGFVVADKVELVVAERLRGVKLPQVGIVPRAAKYSVLFLVALIALSQVGVATGALVVSLGAYFVAVIVITVVAFKDMLASGAAGVYLLLNQPYGIGDEVRVGGTSGIVSEMDLLVTHIDSENEEVILPNSKVFETGIVRVR